AATQAFKTSRGPSLAAGATAERLHSPTETAVCHSMAAWSTRTSPEAMAATAETGWEALASAARVARSETRGNSPSTTWVTALTAAMASLTRGREATRERTRSSARVFRQ